MDSSTEGGMMERIMFYTVRASHMEAIWLWFWKARVRAS